MSEAAARIVNTDYECTTTEASPELQIEAGAPVSSEVRIAFARVAVEASGKVAS